MEFLGKLPVAAPPIVIATDLSTSLTEVADRIYLYNSSGSGPALKYANAPWIVGQSGGWMPIGAVQTVTGYEVAWKLGGADQYTVWNIDSSGNFVSDTIGTVSGTSYALESLEASFQQDLNGDGTIGLTTTVIESVGSTSLTQVADQIYLDNSGGSGTALQYANTPWVVGQSGGWMPIGAEQTATGYEVAWKVTGADQYTVWNTKSNGNLVSDTIGIVSGTSYALESLEASFHQDLNGDGTIGLTMAVIELAGSTSLTQVADQIYLDNSGGSGPALEYANTPWVVGQSGGWMPIGAEQTATGYEVAWKLTVPISTRCGIPTATATWSSI